MRVLMLHDIGTATGGAEHQMLALRRGLRARGHAVELLASRVGRDRAAVEADRSCFGTDSRLQVLSRTANPSAALAVRRAVRDFRPDVVHVRLFLWQLSPLVLPALGGVPALYHAAMYASVCPKGTKLLPGGRACTDAAGAACLAHGCLTRPTAAALAVQRALWRRWRGAFRATVVLSDAMRPVLLGGPDAPPGPVVTIPNGVAERPARPPLTGPPLAAVVARLVPEKGLDVLLRAFAACGVPEARLAVAGDGPERARLEALAAALGVGARVEWWGYVPRAALERRLDAAWAQAVPSQWAEPFGNVTTEAMMRGTAVVASAVGAQPEIVGATGRLVPAADVGAWARALGDVLGDCAEAERLGAAGRERARAEFSEARCLDRFEALYAQIVRGSAPVAASRPAVALAGEPRG